MDRTIRVTLTSNAAGYRSDMRDAARATTAFGKASSGATTGAAGLKRELSATAKATTGVGSATATAARGASGLKRELGATAKATTGAGKAADGAARDVAGLNREMFGLKAIGREAAGTMAGFVGAQALVGGGQAVLRNVVGGWMALDDKMTQSLAIMSGVTPAMRAEMEATARVAAVDFAMSADSAAESYYFLASAGYDAATAIKAMPQVAAFAKAGMLDMATATDYAADAQSAMGLKTADAGENLEQLTRITDVLTQANILSNGSVEQFSAGLTNKAAASARLAGIELEEVVAVLAAFADQGLKGLKAGEAFSIVLRDLQTKSKKNAEEFAQLNVRVYELDGSMRPLSAIVGDLEAALAGASVEEQNMRLGMLGFDAEAMAYIKTLLGTSDAIARYETNLQSAGGVTQEVAEKQMGSMIERLKQAKQAAIDLGFTGLDMLAEGAAWLGETFEDAGREILDVLLAALDAVEPFASALLGLGAGAIIGGLRGLATILEVVFGWLGENEWAVRALVAVLAAKLVLAATEAGVALAQAAAKAVAGKWAAAAGDVRYLGFALSTTAASAGVMGTAMQVLSALRPALAFAGLAVLVMGVAEAFQQYAAKAEEARDAAEAKIDNTSLETHGESITKLIDERERLVAAYNDQGPWDRFAGALADTVVPIHNVEDSAADLKAEMDGMGDVIEEQSIRWRQWEDAIGFVATQLNMSEDAAEAFMRKLGEKADPTAMSIGEVRDAVNDAALAAKFGSVKTDVLADSFGTVADETSTATDRLKAYKDALDALIGVTLNAYEAETAWGNSLQGLFDSVVENGPTLNVLTQAGRDNRDAFAGAAQSALDHAVAVAEETGSIEAGNRVLVEHRAKLVQVMTQMFGSRAAAEDYVNQLGLTPENLATAIHLNGVEGAQTGLAGVQGQLADVKQGAHGQVTLDTRPAVTALQQFLASIGWGQFVLPGQLVPGPAGTGTVLRPQADGSVLKFYGSGGVEDHVAQIAPGGAMRVWAEPETWGESYIPHAPGKRGRALAITERTANLFGHRLVPFASGGMYGRGAGAGGPGSVSVVIGAGAVKVEVRADAGVDSGRLGEVVEAAANRALDAFGERLEREVAMA